MPRQIGEPAATRTYALPFYRKCERFPDFMRHAYAGGIAQGYVRAFDLGAKLRAKWQVGVCFNGGCAGQSVLGLPTFE